MTDARVLKAESGTFKLQGYAPALILDGAERVEVHDFDEGQSSAKRIGEGISVQISRGVARGRSSERRCMNVLTSALTKSGRLVSKIMSADDSRGEDGQILFVDGSTQLVQVVSVPIDSRIGAEASRGALSEAPSDSEAAMWIYRAINHKLSVPPEVRQTILLALDARHFGMLSHPKVLEALVKLGPDPSSFGFKEIWLVGPTVPRSVRLAYCTAPNSKAVCTGQKLK